MWCVCATQNSPHAQPLSVITRRYHPYSIAKTKKDSSTKFYIHSLNYLEMCLKQRDEICKPLYLRTCLRKLIPPNNPQLLTLVISM